MRCAIVLVVIGVTVIASAGTHKVLVLPLDGNAPAAQRSKLNARVVKMAKKNLTGSVTVADTTFAETAAAVGCDPKSDACAQTVMSTLAVDELVYGTATKTGNATTIEIKRAIKGQTPRAQSTTIAASDNAEKAEPGLEPVFGASAPPAGSDASITAAAEGSNAGSGSGSGSGPAIAETPRPRPTEGFTLFDTRDRTVGVALCAGGVASIAIGISFWLSKAKLQDDIDAHGTSTLPEFNDLTALEDRAGSKAMWGNIMFGVGVGLGAAGAYFLYRDSNNRDATVAAVPTENGGMTLTFGGEW